MGDPAGEFTKALDLGFDAPAVFGHMRGKRYALKIVDGKIAAAHVEPDATGYKGEFFLSFFSFSGFEANYDSKF